MIRVLFVCHGNICRSPMAEFILKDMVEKKGLEYIFEIESAATSTEEIWCGKGSPVYPPAQEELRRHNIGQTPYTDFSGKRARQVIKVDYNRFDYIFCADSYNVRNTIRIVGGDPEGKISLLMDQVEPVGKSIADPWYSGDFRATYRDVVAGCEAFLEMLSSKGEI